VGPLSGRSNVIYWLESRGLAASDELVDRIFKAAKESARVMPDAELYALVDASGAAKTPTPR
jgi:isopropylmalate/homocitrate/citramalate synthase